MSRTPPPSFNRPTTLLRAPMISAPNLIEAFFKGQQAPDSARAGLPAVVSELLSKPVSHYQAEQSGRSSEQPPLTQVAFILDGSQSMEDGKNATVEGYNTQLNVVKEGARQAGHTLYTDVRFNSQVNVRCVAASLDEMMPLTEKTYETAGWTALYDAIGYAIVALLKTPGIHDPNTAVLVTVFTDGYDNRSTMYDAITLRAMIERLEATGRWTFAVVGPMQSVQGLASALSVSQKNIAGFDVDSVASKQDAFGKVAAASASYMALRSVGGTQSMSLYDEDQVLPRVGK